MVLISRQYPNWVYPKKNEEYKKNIQEMQEIRVMLGVNHWFILSTTLGFGWFVIVLFVPFISILTEQLMTGNVLIIISLVIKITWRDQIKIVLTTYSLFLFLNIFKIRVIILSYFHLSFVHIGTPQEPFVSNFH